MKKPSVSFGVLCTVAQELSYKPSPDDDPVTAWSYYQPIVFSDVDSAVRAFDEMKKGKPGNLQLLFLGIAELLATERRNPFIPFKKVMLADEARAFLKKIGGDLNLPKLDLEEVIHYEVKEDQSDVKKISKRDPKEFVRFQVEEREDVEVFKR